MSPSMHERKYVFHFSTLLGLIFCLTLIILAEKLLIRSALADTTQPTEEKVYIFLKPVVEPGKLPKITIFSLFFDEKTKVGKIPVRVESVGFWRSKKTLNDTLYDLFEIPGGSHTTEVGEPMISTISVEVEIPADAHFKEVLVEATLIRKFENIILAPQQEPLPVVRPIVPKEEFIQEKPKFTINNEVYNQTRPYPGEYYRIIADSFLGECHIIVVRLFPIQFYPAQKEVRVSSLEMEVIFTKQE